MRHSEIERLRTVVCDRVAAILGAEIICDRCGCSFQTMNEKCSADLLDLCPGFNRVDAVQVPIEREVGLA